MPGLSIADIVNVQVNLSPIAVPLQNFGVLCIAGPSDVIDVQERLRPYTTLTAIAADFGTAAPEYAAAQAFFSQSPTPSLCYIARMASGGTSAILHGAPLNAATQAYILNTIKLWSNGGLQITVDGVVQQAQASAALLIGGSFTTAGQSTLLTQLQAITNGQFALTVNGTARQIGPMNFFNVASLTAAAVIIDSALSASGCDALWSQTASNYQINTQATGSGQTISYAGAPTSGTDISALLQLTSTTGALVKNGTAAMNFSGVTNLNGVAAIIDAALPGARCFFTGNQFNIESASRGAGSTLTFTSPIAGTQNVGNLLHLDGSGGGLPPVQGVVAENYLQCAAALRLHPEWYALYFTDSSTITAPMQLNVASFIEAASPVSIYCVTTQDPLAMDSSSTADVPAQLQSKGYSRTFCQYSSTNKHAVCSLFGRFATIDYQGFGTAITGKFKQEPSIQGEQLTEGQSTTLRGKNCNVYVYYANNIPIIQEAVMSNGFFIDERTDLDWLANEVQVNLFNVLFLSPSKVPQTDAGVHLLVTSVSDTCAQGVVNGTIAPGQWNGPDLGQIVTGQQLSTGFYVYAAPVASQPQATRDQRIAPTIQAAIKLAGAVHFSDVIVNVNR
jgi:hypothetical protein